MTTSDKPWDGRKTLIPTECVVCGQYHHLIPGSGGFYLEQNEFRTLKHDCIVAMRQACACEWNVVISNLYGLPGREFPNGPLKVETERNWREPLAQDIIGPISACGAPSGVCE